MTAAQPLPLTQDTFNALPASEQDRLILERARQAFTNFADALMRFHYCNHAQEISFRDVVVEKVYFGTKLPWYPEPTWLMDAYDLDRDEHRTFDTSRILSVAKD